MKKIFSHKLTVQDLIIREDAETSSTRTEEYFGKVYPIVRLNDTIFDGPSIKGFSLSINPYTLVPTLTVSIDDSDFNNRDSNFVEQNNVLTIFVGNAVDEYHEPIKNDYYIIDAMIDDDSGTYTIEAILDVKDLYYSQNRVFVNKSSIEIFQFIAEECKLGFVTNINNTNDRMNWIQYQPNHAFLEYLTGRAYINDDTKIVVFIDQFANLNVVDVSSAISSPGQTTFITNSRGEKLTKDVAFRMTNWDYGKDADDVWCLLESYSPSNNVGKYSKRFSQQLVINNMNIETLESTESDIQTDEERLHKSSSYTSFVSSNTFPQYDYAKQLNGNFNNRLFQLENISCSTGTYMPQLFMFMGCPVDIHDALKHATRDSQDTEVTNDNFTEHVDVEEKSLNANKNEKRSGTYMIINMSYSYTFSDDDMNQVRQHLTMAKIL